MIAPASKPLGSHDKFLASAESAARQLIGSQILYGVTRDNELDPDLMPTGVLAEVAGGVLHAIIDEGARDIADIVPHFHDAAQVFKDELIECSQGVPPRPEHCGPLIQRIRRYDTERRKQTLLWDLQRRHEIGEPIADQVRQLAEIEAGVGESVGMLERAYDLRFVPDDIPPPDETCMVIGDIPIASRGNLTVIQGKSKVGKSAVVAAVLGAVQRGNHYSPADTFQISWKGEGTGAIIHIDTEQSPADWHGLVSRSVTRSGLPEVSGRLVSLPLVMFARSERMEILKQSLKREAKSKGGIDAVIIDGVADLCASPNDEAESLEVVSNLMAFSHQYLTPIFCVLHENPGTEQRKTRGHLGSELNRKAFGNLCVDKDVESGVSTIYGPDMRKRDIPKEQGFCFAWDEQAGMHTYQGRAAGLKAAQSEARASQDARNMFQPIFDHAHELKCVSGTNCPCPALTPKEAAEIERDISGTEKSTKTETMKKRMQRAETLGVLRKKDLLHWLLVPAGQAGQ